MEAALLSLLARLEGAIRGLEAENEKLREQIAAVTPKDAEPDPGPPEHYLKK